MYRESEKLLWKRHREREKKREKRKEKGSSGQYGYYCILLCTAPGRVLWTQHFVYKVRTTPREQPQHQPPLLIKLSLSPPPLLLSLYLSLSLSLSFSSPSLSSFYLTPVTWEEKLCLPTEHIHHILYCTVNVLSLQLCPLFIRPITIILSS